MGRAKHGVRSSHGWKKAAFVAGAVLGLPVAVAALDLLLHLGRIHHGVVVSGVNLGHFTPSEAVDQLGNQMTARGQEPITVTYRGKAWTFAPAEVGFQPDVRERVELAARYGRQGGLLLQVSERASGWFAAQPVEAGGGWDNKKLDAFVSSIASQMNKAPVNATVVIDRGLKAHVGAERAGLKVRAPALRTALQELVYEKPPRRLALPVTVVDPAIDKREALRAGATAKKMLAQSAFVRFGEASWELTPAFLRDRLVFAPEEEEGETVLGVAFDKEKITQHLAGLTKTFRRPAVDAQFVVSGEKGDSITIAPSKNGREIDLEGAYTYLMKVSTLEGPRLVLLSTRVVPPKLTVEEASKLGIKEKISSYTTTFSAGQRSRVHNIQLLSSTLDGTIVAPGETFSFNESIGPRTAAKGYKQAPVIVNGELVPGLGGGVCQVGTTAFNAIFFAGLKVKERRNHSIYISHYPAGRDATLSWPNVDIKFVNDTKAHVLVKATTTRSSVTVALYGTNPKREVTHTTSGFSSFSSYGIKRVNDPTLEKGKQVLVEPGIKGRKISVTRIVKEGGKVLHKDTFVSKYRARVAIMRVGTKEPAPSRATPTSSVTTSPRPPAGETN